MIGPIRYEHPAGIITIPVRDFACSSYNSCLLLGARKNWPSFTCLGCEQNRARGGHEYFAAALADDAVDVDTIDLCPAMDEPEDLDLDHRCVDCGRVGDDQVVHLVAGAPRCLICRPDLGRGNIGALSARILAGTHLLRPFISLADLARVVRAQVNTVRKHVGRSVQYRLNERLVLIPARLAGIACENHMSSSATKLGIDDVAAWLGLRTAHGGALIGLMGGQEVVHWLDLAHRLNDCCLIGGSQDA